jgi:pimeloyl-ACP methyl ester carboxylesterase
VPRKLVEWLFALAALAVGLPAAAWLAQERLIFFPQPLMSAAAPAGTQPLEVIAADGTRLRGWLRPAASTPAPTLLYFGGNAEEVSWTIGERRWPRELNVVAVNYRGYGASEGEPGERALVADAIAIHDAIVARPETDRSRVYAMGRSLGTGVAVQLAAARPVARLVLASPFDSLVALGRLHYPLLPVGLLLRHRFDAASLAPSITAPMLAIVAERDAIIPVERSRALYDAWGGPKSWHVVAGTDHNTLSVPDAFWDAIASFLRADKP